MSRFLSKRLEGLESYTPGEQPQDKKYIKLNTNESPFPPSPEVIKAINTAEVSALNLYPDPKTSSAKKAISEHYNAQHYKIDEDEIILGNGSDEILAFSFFAFCDKETGVCFPDISYGFYEVYADLYNFKKEIIPLDDDFRVVPEDYFDKNKTIFIANPNAPTGLALSLDDIERILQHNQKNVVVIDEAYVDFGGESAVGLIHKYDNLLVVQTFSKSRNLAGARLGMAIGNKELISDLNRIKFSFNPYNINRLSLLCAEASMKDTQYFKKCTEEIIRVREFLTAEFREAGFTVIDSKTNFVFVKSEKISGKNLYLGLKEKGILVRHWESERIKDYVRITIGTQEQILTLIKALKSL